MSTSAGELRTLADWLADYRTLGPGRFLEPAGPVLVLGAPVVDTFSTLTESEGTLLKANEVRQSRLPEEQVVISVMRRAPTATPHISVGRAPICDVVLPFSQVSKVHAYVNDPPTGWTIFDAGSTNGTRVNEHKLVPGEWHALGDGHRVSFGSLMAEFWLPASFVNRVLANRR